MTEIKFRGKKYVNNGQWAFGDLVQGYDTKKFICDLYGMDGPVSENIVAYDVIPQTIGQYTGIDDKIGQEIYSGDIIEISHPHKNRRFVGIVERLDYGFGCKGFHFTHFDNPGDIFSEGTEYIKVIGNEYDHPKILGKIDE